MKNWTEATRDDVVKEVIPGVETLNDFEIGKLDWTSYLSHIGEWLSEGLNQYRDAVEEHFDFLVFTVHNERIRAERGDYPELEEAEAYMKLPDTKALVRYLTDITVRMTKENWPGFREMVCEKVGLNPDDFRLDFE